ncbi:S-adenosyl-L-methionine-dependent methyltransferase [Parathielavia appendiculata]|uniref:S-adenosyl-L-methionine-dependent methyltransferase n=1 Tax=Parathielavia appendiculata TaxID=2587402 RepID=A0AAN6UAN4_9PEZI|nr:S-adenosyl-L-methionine-dependent methyltransferase [Parathielavia appendiculata]
MAAEQKDNWSSEAYQNAASFVPKLATKVIQWLDPQKDDVIFDVGCGDGVLNLQMARILSEGSGQLHGIDSSPAMIAAAKAAAASAGLSDKCTFEVLDATTLTSTRSLQRATFTKAFSNAALHWILRPPATREAVFRGVRDALAPGGTFVFEMGGLGNVPEIRAALLSVVGRRVGLARAQEADPWFFPDEGWVRDMLEVRVGGWKVERAEREWRPTAADRGGVEGWVRLMGKKWFEVVPEGEREQCIREVVEVLEVVCRQPGGGHMLSYVRLRVMARKI